MKLEYAHDMRVHESQVGLPLIPQTLAGGARRYDLEGDSRTCHPIAGEPRFRFSALAERSLQRIPVG